MKKYFTSLVVIFALVLTIRGVGASSQEAAPPAYDLAITAIEINPPAPHAQEEIAAIVAYQNESDHPIGDVDVYIVMTLTAVGETQPYESVPCSEKSAADGLAAGLSNQHTFNACLLTAPVAGQYQITAQLSASPDGTAPFDDANPENNVLTSDPLQISPFGSALPDELGRLFAGLGMFAAVMAIMAVGTEVVIDTFKVFIGMKSKVTSLETLERFEELMPGQLTTLGVDAKTQEQFKKLTQDMRATLKPVQSLGDAAAKIKAGDFGAAFDALSEIKVVADSIDQLLAQGNMQIDTQLDKLGQLAGSALAKAFEGLDKTRLKLGVGADVPLIANVFDWLKAKLNQETIDNTLAEIKSLAQHKKVDDIRPLLTQLGNLEEDIFDQLKTWSQNLTGDWLENQLGTLQTLTEDQITSLFEAKIEPTLNNLGFLPDGAVENAKKQLHSQLSILNLKAVASAGKYVDSLRNLLDGVEARRYAMQSPLRKMWRRLRHASFGDKFLALFLGLIDATILWIWETPIKFILGGDLSQSHIFWYAHLGGLIMAVIYWIILLLLAQWGKTLYNRKLHEAYTQAQRIGDQKKLAQVGLFRREIDKLTTLHYVEYLWNYARGDQNLDPHKFDKAPQVEQMLNTEITATTAAQVVLARTDQQRDEESSRLRWLRAISVVVGMYLAYLLQIDAAELLDTAVPGIAQTINDVFRFSGEELHKFWPVLASDRAITAGIVLTGLAASAGSTFWHDQLDRLQSAKKGAESAAQLLQQAKQVVGKPK